MRDLLAGGQADSASLEPDGLVGRWFAPCRGRSYRSRDHRIADIPVAHEQGAHRR
jgi:hypothetical protein